MTECVPRALGQQAARGDIDAGLLPVADYFRLEGRFERLGPLGIAVRGRVRSVLLFARTPIRQLEGATIAVTEETSTSAVLLRLLLEQRYHVTPSSYTRTRDLNADALMLIGDEALRFRTTNTQYPFEVDLAFEWWLWQHLPFVFAVWAIRKDLPASDKKAFETTLSKTLGVNQHQHELIASEYAPVLGVPVEELTVYLSQFIYRLGASEEEGLQQFRKLIDESHLL